MPLCFIFLWEFPKTNLANSAPELARTVSWSSEGVACSTDIAPADGHLISFFLGGELRGVGRKFPG